jgi:hypothetical protein
MALMRSVSYSWEEILSLLTKSGEVICSVRLLDTIFLNPQNGLLCWYFTTKNGAISKKKSDKCTIDAITTRFNRFAMSNPNNSLQYVGTLVQNDKRRQYFTSQELTSYLSSQTNPSSSVFLQVYLRPSDGIDQVIRVVKKKNQENFQFTILSHENTVSSTGLHSLSDSSFISDQCTVFMKEIMKSLSLLYSDFTLTDLIADFIIDDNKHVWLSTIPQVQFQTNVPLDSETLSPDPSSSLPDLPNSSQSNRKSQPTSPHLPSSQPTLTSERLLWREAGIYRCKVGPEGLPGLRAWVLNSLSKQQTPSHNDWIIDLNEISLPSFSSNITEIYQNRASTTRAISSKMILLIEHFQPLLRGEINHLHVTTVTDFTGQWKLFFNEFQKKLKEKKLKTTGEVTVDGNVHAICQKLQSLLDINFEAKGSLAKVL